MVHGGGRVNYSRPLSVLALAALGISLDFTLESPRFITLSPQRRSRI
jgi:hypothetical protein